MKAGPGASGRAGRRIAVLGLVLAFAILYWGIPSTGGWVWRLPSLVREYRSHAHLPYADRAFVSWGDAYRLIRTVASSTPSDARILIPSGADHEPLSNRTWALYYLYPRRLLYEEDLDGPVVRNVDYVLVTKGWGLRQIGVPEASIKGTESGVIDVKRYLEQSGRSGP